MCSTGCPRGAAGSVASRRRVGAARLGGRSSRARGPRAALFDAERQAELVYFDAMGVLEVTRTLFAAVKMPFKDNRYKVEISDGKPAVESRHAEDKEAGVFAANLNRLPLLVLPDGAVVGQSKAIERMVARELGLMGSTEVEAAQIDAYCEHVRDIREAFAKARGTPFGPKNAETEEKLVKWFDEDMPNWMARLEKATGDSGFAVGSKLSLADVALYIFLTQGISDQERCKKTYAACPSISGIVSGVGELEGVQMWLRDRPETMF